MWVLQQYKASVMLSRRCRLCINVYRSSLIRKKDEEPKTDCENISCTLLLLAFVLYFQKCNLYVFIYQLQ